MLKQGRILAALLFTLVVFTFLYSLSYSSPDKNPPKEAYSLAMGFLACLGGYLTYIIMLPRMQLNSALRKKDFEKAQAICLKRIEKFSDDLFTTHILASIFVLKRQPEQALLLCDKIINSAPRVSDYHATRAAALIFLQRYDEAYEACKSALALDPNSVFGLINLGEVYLKTQKLEKALETLQKVENLNLPQVLKAFALANKAKVYLAMGDESSAQGLVDAALELHPDCAGARCTGGLILLRKEMFERSVEELSKAIESDQYATEAYFYRSEAYEALGKSDLAELDISKATELRYRC